MGENSFVYVVNKNTLILMHLLWVKNTCITTSTLNKKVVQTDIGTFFVFLTSLTAVKLKAPSSGQ